MSCRNNGSERRGCGCSCCNREEEALRRAFEIGFAQGRRSCLVRELEELDCPWTVANEAVAELDSGCVF